MRKLLVLPIIMAVFFANFGAFGAAVRSTRGGANANNSATSSTGSSAPVAARAGVRGAKPASTTAAQPAQQNAPVAARAAARNTPKTTATAGAKPSAGGAVAARAGAKQKVINMGTKVESATANTVVSEECQNAYYGCMDAFCMLDNVSGGRCQCSDRHAELEKVLADIMALDEQSYLMATEGVERLQMGQNADEIMARAKGAADKVAADSTKKQKEEAKKKRKSLDLSSWSSLSFDDEEDDIFGGLSEDGFKDDISGKTGDTLHNAAAKLCKAQVPAQCKASTSMLQLTYAQKIKSDCSAYENSLKQQQTKSAEKLREAKQALRETALEQFQNENKYDLGGCVLAFRECMQTTGGCGDDFSGCVADTVTLAIDENQSRTTSAGKKSSDFTKTKSINTGVVNINIDAATYGILESKKLMCESVLNQCVKVRDGVWDAFLRDVAPTIKTAQVNAESNRRMDCVTVIANCVKKSCGSKWDEESDNYDACINDMEYVKSTCGIEAQKCGNDGITTSLFNYVQQKLSAMKVDRCTTQVKECLQSENACGPDYLGCLGLSANKILTLCPVAKLTSCMEKFNENSAREYVVKVAQGLALNMDNAFAKKCQNAVDEAMIKVCGDTESCSGLEIDNSSLIDELLEKLVKYKSEENQSYTIPGFSTVMKMNIAGGNNSGIFIDPKLLQLSFPHLQTNAIWGASKSTSNTTASKSTSNGIFVTDANLPSIDLNDVADDLQKSMEQNLKLILSSIENDATVKACREGRSPQWFSGSGSSSTGDKSYRLSDQSTVRFPNITDNIKYTIATRLYNMMANTYSEKLSEMKDSVKTSKSGDSDAASDSEDETASCAAGSCSDCDSASDLCKCIAKSYFQSGFVKHHNNKYERVMLSSSVATYADGVCSFTYRRHKSCSTSSGTNTGFNCTKHDKDFRVSFDLKEGDKVTFGDPSASSSCNIVKFDGGDASDVARELQIGDTVKICFNKCTTDFVAFDESQTPKYGNWNGSRLWCQLHEMNTGSSYVKSLGTELLQQQDAVFYK